MSACLPPRARASECALPSERPTLPLAGPPAPHECGLGRSGLGRVGACVPRGLAHRGGRAGAARDGRVRVRALGVRSSPLRCRSLCWLRLRFLGRLLGRVGLVDARAGEVRLAGRRLALGRGGRPYDEADESGGEHDGRPGEKTRRLGAREIGHGSAEGAEHRLTVARHGRPPRRGSHLLRRRGRARRLGARGKASWCAGRGVEGGARSSASSWCPCVRVAASWAWQLGRRGIPGRRPSSRRRSTSSAASSCAWAWRGP